MEVRGWDEGVPTPGIGPEAVWASEILVRDGGLPHLVHGAIAEAQRPAVANEIMAEAPLDVVLGGMGSMTPGLPERLQESVRLLGSAVAVHAVRERKHAAWIGASVLSGLGTSVDMAIAKCEYAVCRPAQVRVCRLSQPGLRARSTNCILSPPQTGARGGVPITRAPRRSPATPARAHGHGRRSVCTGRFILGHCRVWSASSR